MSRFLTLLAAALTLLVATPASAQDPTHGGQPGAGVPQDSADADPKPDREAVEEKLVFALSGYEHFPDRAELDDLGSTDLITDLLRDIAMDDDHKAVHRLRAVDALGYYGDDETAAFLTDIIDTDPETLDADRRRIRGLLRHHAITALAKARGEDAVDTLAGLLEAKDLQIRLTAISALGKHGGAPGEERLREYEQKTDDQIELRELRKHLD